MTRIWEIDCLRGLAIVLMIAYHLIFDLREFYHLPVSYSSGFWFYLGKTAAVLFIVLCGISASLSRCPLRHGFTILFWALLLTIITYAYSSSLYIRFGILHLLGLSLISYPLLALWRPYILIFTALVIFIGSTVIDQASVNYGWWLIIGLGSTTFASLDYYPLIPWYGFFLLGTAAGKHFYITKRSLLASPPAPASLNLLGRRSLLIYLIHQPLILSILSLLHYSGVL